MTEPLRWGVLGAAWIADRAVIPALQAATGCELVAIASRDPERAAAMGRRHGVARVHAGYQELLDDPEVDAVYLPLANNLHREWTLRALAAGKHVLCEKPLALNGAEAEEMAAAAAAARRLLMEAAMYRFHPRMRRLVASFAEERIRHLYTTFGFTIRTAGNYRLQPELGGGALLDVGFYVADLARWMLGEPQRVEAAIRRAGQEDGREDGVDMSCSVLLAFPSGAHASLFCSFESPEVQDLIVISDERVVQTQRPFSGWRDPDDPYQIMVEEFARAAQAGEPAPLPVESSIANMRLLDRIRAAARTD
ncbi:MAG: oxidoreductase [Candidatus Nephthysia bennettiae]|uniref:Gfo/Idh/MocA family oxidoreductase n=1 Tax=Candidatus Nephthysia bennettiae TaxID=3127016 RepID=A0A934JZL7_9BACT|nr:Gfo/Idh/MocA family oxidoreductase [Candidatus Dormibacteraeota bacterium]MBJ7614728.1 Gfo/Idh/MocA family oxidoreductase [Candidatus Dormibacteraeota bacterium]PZR94620.1 MAG: oxidoreductase [Candidatus Dormibacteraeota bacterium]